MLDTYDVLKQISAEWDNMTNAEKSSLAIDLAKKTQMDTFLAVLGNFEDAEKAYTTALYAEGSAWKENEAYMESVEAHVQQLSAAWERFVLSAPIADLEKKIIDLGTTIINFVNSGLGKFVIAATAATTAIIALNKVLAAKSATNVFASAITSLIAGEATLTQVTVGLTTALLSNPLFIGAAAVAGIVALVKAVDYFTVSMEESTEALQEANEAVKNTEASIESLKGQIEDIRKKIIELNKQKIGLTDDEVINNLKAETAEYTRQEAILINQLALEKEKLKVEKDRQAEAAKTAMQSKTTTTIYNNDDAAIAAGGVQVGENAVDFTGDSKEQAELLIKAMENTQAKIEICRISMKKLKEGTEEYQQVASRQQELVGQYDEMSEALQPILENMQSLIEAGEDGSKVYQNLYDKFIEITGVKDDLKDMADTASDATQELAESFGYKNYEDFIQALEDAGGSVEEFEDALANGEDAAKEYARSILNTKSEIEELNEAIATHTENLQSIQSAYTTLTAAVEEYNSTGSFTAETLSKLNGLTAEQIAALETHNGVMSVNVDLLQQQFEAEKQEMINKLQLAKQIAIVALEEQYLNQEAQATGSQLETQQTINENTATTYNDIYTAASNAAAGVAKVRAALGEDSDEYKQFLEDRKSIIDDYDKMIDDVKNTSLSLASANKSSAKKSSSAHKEAAKETKDAWKEAFEEEQRQLKHMLEMDEISEYEYYERLKALNEKYFGEISGNHEKYIKEYQENEEQIYKGMKSVYDKVKDYLREAVENGYEKAISALEKEEKQVLAGIKKQIEALKKEKEQVLDGIQKEIDALEKQKEQVQKYWDDQIDAIKRENEVLEQQNQLLEYQQALQQAKAQKVMVMQDGRFQLGENESAVSQAEQNLSNYEDQLSYEQQIQQMEDLRDAQIESIEERIEALEEYKDFMEEYYDEQIEAMEEYYEQVQEQYEQQIEALQAELDAFKEGYQKSEDLDNARLATEVMAANEEAEVWQARLENLAAAVTEYNRLLALMGEAGATATASFSPTMSSHENSANVAQVDHVIQSRASGDSDFADDEVALVGESPNTELILGSKLNRSVNSGELVHLSRGSGVVNAESTSTLAGILNGLAKPNSSGIGYSTQQNFSFGNITLPNVTDADSFVKTLSTQFNNYAIQYGNNRR